MIVKFNLRQPKIAQFLEPVVNIQVQLFVRYSACGDVVDIMNCRFVHKDATTSDVPESDAEHRPV